MAEHRKPHVVCIPAPFQSHIKALAKLARLLYHKGFYITFVNTEFNHRRFLKYQSYSSLAALPGFRFESIPDGLPPPDNPDATQDSSAIVGSLIQHLMAQPFKDLLRKINDVASTTSNDAVPPVSCILSDGLMGFTICVGRELNIRTVMVFTISVTCTMTMMQFRALKERGLIPLTDESNMDTIIDWIPGLKNIRLKDLPSYVRITEQSIFNYLLECLDRAVDASAIVVETFDALEQQVLSALSSLFPRIYSIAPLQLLLNQLPQDHRNPRVSYSLWKEEKGCLKWLDKQKPNSVVYVNFGSLATMDANQLVEFTTGLVNSNHPFLWIMRPDLVEGDEVVLPKEFTKKIKEERGFVASWCDQEEVLNHMSIGGFVTQCGRNSILESLTVGVPMLCYPFFGDQLTNSWLVCGELGVGMEMERDVERKVNELMEGERGKVMKEKAMEWRRLASEAASPKGSSSINLDQLVNQLLDGEDC